MKIALIDDPKNCENCPLRNKEWCELIFKEIEDSSIIPEWCALADFPDYRSLDEGDDHPINDGYVLGWNALLNKITRERWKNERPL